MSKVKGNRRNKDTLERKKYQSEMTKSGRMPAEGSGTVPAIPTRTLSA
jgi:hypothetical protein